MQGTVALDLVHANLGVTVMPRRTAAQLTPAKDFALTIGKRGLWLDWFVVTRREPCERPLATFLDVLLEQHAPARAAKVPRTRTLR